VEYKLFPDVDHFLRSCELGKKRIYLISLLNNSKKSNKILLTYLSIFSNL
jgi:hypothetical protein